jgi:AraC-like DNA-binding protein
MKAELIIDAPIIDQKKIWIKNVEKAYLDHPFHFHHLCELTWIEKGYGNLILGDYVGCFSEGELLLENAKLPHLFKCDPAFYDKKQNLCTKATAIYFPPTLIPKITDDTECISLYLDTLDKAERGLRFYGQTKKKAIELIKKTRSTNGLEQLGYFLQIIALINRSKEFECLAIVGYKNSNNEQDMDRFNKVYQFLLRNFNREIMVCEVAAICYMTPNSFCRYFKTKTQKTFTRFLNELRVGHACKLLQNNNASVLSVCYESGFNSPVNFFKFFKLVTNKTPREYRNSCVSS